MSSNGTIFDKKRYPSVLLKYDSPCLQSINKNKSAEYIECYKFNFSYII